MYTRILRTTRRLALTRTPWTPTQINTCSTIDLNCRLTPPVTNNSKKTNYRSYCYTSETRFRTVSQATFEEICSETLESLCDHFEEIIDNDKRLKGADVTYSDGVLTVDFGTKHGTYVINRQSPNRQIWLSSPISGPKRYDLEITDNVRWVYKHDGVTLHNLLQQEISKIAGSSYYIAFNNCSHSNS